jgi:hypothetical protein
MHNFTLEAEDQCGESDTDIVRAMAVDASPVTVKEWTFNNGTPEALTTESMWRTTDECEAPGNDSYLAFNQPDVCNYNTTEPVLGNATFDYNLERWSVIGLEFRTLWDTRDTYVEEIQDHITVQTSFDGGSTWTSSALTFDYAQGEHEEGSEWVRGAGIYDIGSSSYDGGNIQFRFTFETNSTVDEGNLGWLVDDVRLVGLDRAVYDGTINVSTSNDTTKVQMPTDYESTQISTEGNDTIIQTASGEMKVTPNEDKSEVHAIEDGRLTGILNMYTPGVYSVGKLNLFTTDAFFPRCEGQAVFETHHTEWDDGSFSDHTSYVTLEWRTDSILDDGGSQSWSQNATSAPRATLIHGNKTWDGGEIDADDIDAWVNLTVAVDYETAVANHNDGQGDGVYDHREVPMEMSIDGGCK